MKINVKHEEWLLCAYCLEMSAANSMKPHRLERHLETIHRQYVKIPKEFFGASSSSFSFEVGLQPCSFLHGSYCCSDVQYTFQRIRGLPCDPFPEDF